MNKPTTEKRLELVRSIRLQNQYNRSLCREREGLLYGTESAAILPREALPEEMPVRRPASFAGGFRIRFLLAVLILGGVILLDQKNTAFFGKTVSELAGEISKTREWSLPEALALALKEFDL